MFMCGKRLAVFLILLLGGIGSAAADVSLDFGVESFRWREFDAGAQLLKETGPRYRIGATWRRPVGVERRDYLNVRGSVYLGRVDYDGQACTLSGVCVPFKSDADYTGAAAEAVFGRALGASRVGRIFGGGGIDIWRRNISGRGSVSGSIEDWTVFYLMAGGGAHWTSPTTTSYASAGLKYPFYTANMPDSYDVTLEPKGRASFFARFETDFIETGRPRWGLGVYYDGYRFAASNTKRVGSVIVWQPESKQDVIGIYTTVHLR